MTTTIRTLACALAGVFAFATQAFAEDTFPRLGGYPISGPHDYDRADYQKDIAKLDVVVLNVYPSWKKNGQTITNVVNNIHAINPKTRVTTYVIGESFYTPAPTVWSAYETKVNAESWWLNTTGTNKVLSDFGHDMYVLNITPYSRKDSSGRTFGQWFAGFVTDSFVKQAPGLNGIYTDNVFWKPRRDGDWNRDGKIDSQNDPTVQAYYRNGYRQYAEALRKAAPGKILLANVADWVQPAAVLTEYQGVFDGGVLEAIIGKSYSIEERQGWAVMMAGYRKTMAALGGEKLGIFEQQGDRSDYQAMRYGLTSCLMDNGYYTFQHEAINDYGVNWFDEYDAKLGAATSAPQTKAWQKGVYRRDFEGGIALVNPKGNGPQEVTLEGEFVKLKGTQVPSLNNGQTVTKVTLKDRDGIILMRKNPTKRPAAPGAITIETAG